MYEKIPQIVKAAGQIVLEARDIRAGVTEKTLPCDLVTKYDPMVENFLRRELLAAFPQAGFFGEEEQEHEIRGKDLIFIVDPIDGTTNFVRELHHSCISVGLWKQGQMEFAAVYNPYYDELFTAQQGQGAYLNGKHLWMEQPDLDHSLVLFGSAIYYRETVPATLRFVQELFPRALDFRRGGSAALDLCYLAAGRADLFFECCLQPWDYAAGSLIVREAGGLVTSMQGSPLRLFEKCSVAAGNTKNHAELLEISRNISREQDMKGRIR